MDSGGASVVVEIGMVEVLMVGNVVVVVATVVVSLEVFLLRRGMVVFHWKVEKGLVTLAGSVTSWSPTVDRRDSGTVGRSQAGRLLSDSSAKDKKIIQ